MKNKTAQHLVPFLLLFIAACSHDKQTTEILAVIGDRAIAVDDLILRAEFSPERLSLGKDFSKKQLFDVLIDEKLLAIEAENHRLEQTLKISWLSQFVEDLAVMRALFRDEVQNHVQLDSAQIEQALTFSRQERKISYLSFKDKTTAQKYQTMWCNTSLQKVSQDINEDHIDSLAFQRSIKWDETDAELEAAIFGLQLGDISPVLEQSGAFLIVRCDDIRQNAAATASHFADQKSKVKRILTARQETQLSRAFVSRFMRQQEVKFDVMQVRQVIDALVNLLFSDKSSMELKLKEIPVSESVWQKTFADLSAVQDEELVRFKNGSLTVGEFLAKWRAYRFPVDKTDRAVCACSLNDQFSLVTRDVLLTREGRRRGLEKEPSVKRDVSLWRDYYLAELVVAESDEKEIDALLAFMRKKTAITVNENLLRKTELTDISAIALRPGQYASRVSPPWPSLMKSRK